MAKKNNNKTKKRTTMKGKGCAFSKQSRCNTSAKSENSNVKSPIHNSSNSTRKSSMKKSNNSTNNSTNKSTNNSTRKSIKFADTTKPASTSKSVKRKKTSASNKKMTALIKEANAENTRAKEKEHEENWDRYRDKTITRKEFYDNQSSIDMR